MEYQHVSHTFPPIFSRDSRVLILGTFPSVKSRENQFYYGHPQNRFWRILAAVTESAVPRTVEEKRAFLLQHRIAIWDVVASCDIVGSSDSSIKNVVPANLQMILKKAPIMQIYANGGKAWQLYQKYSYPQTGRPCLRLPSSSPANASWNMERLVQSWSTIKEPLQQP